MAAPLTVFALALGLAGAGLPLAAAPASAATPVPHVRSFGAAIDPLASYDAQSTCDPAAKPGALALARLIRATYGSSQSVGISRACGSKVSEHMEGRALDWMTSARVPAQKARGDAFVTWLKATDGHDNAYAMVRRLGVMYIIWKGRMWRAYDPHRGGASGWTEYSSCLTKLKARAYDTTCHRDHVHISLSREGAAALTSYYTGKPLPKTCATGWTSAKAALPTRALGFVPVVQSRILNTRSGYGMASPCRLAAGRRFDVAVTGRRGVPASGVAAVAVGVTLQRATRGTSVTAWPAGAGRPSTTTVSAPSSTTRGGATVVPVGADGKVAFTLTKGSAELAVDILGYYPRTGGSAYHPAQQKRVLDVTVPAKGLSPLSLAGTAGMPASGIAGAVLSVTAMHPQARGGVAVWSGDAPRPPGVPALVMSAGATRTNRVVVPTTTHGALVLENRSSAPVHLLVDTVGWYGGGTARFHALGGGRVLDTRSDKAVSGAFTAGRSATVRVTSTRVPATARAVALQVTSFAPSRSTRLTAWASGTARPTTAAFYPHKGETESNVVLAPVGKDGRVALYNRSGRTHVAANLLGWYG